MFYVTTPSWIFSLRTRSLRRFREGKCLRGSTSTENFFLCFNGMILIFGQLLEHGDTVTKIYFLKLLLPWLPNLIPPNGEKLAHL